ncbi:hypothetical protein [Herbinix luporum]|jgi:O-antigen/teichoic acid export membrane protein|uniref:Putative membrane protein n=1 Tax=Herbinix luporum TaxID=1679721 RepID=A0A0K8J3K5_9FIRM|nr:hypothetical protein [Herbinix luporum]CUH92201.1 putative membrane protein [Herbinix luporum]
MDKKSKFEKYFKIIKPYYKIIDGFSLKFIPMFLVLSFLANIIIKILLQKNYTSKITDLIIMVIAILISLLWTSLVLRTNYSIFDRPLTRYIKKQALTLRGVAIIIFCLIKLIGLGRRFTNLIIVEIIFFFCILVLAISFIIIASIKTRRPIRERI